MAIINGTFLPDIIFGTSEADVIDGGAGLDILWGLGGDDRLIGGGGDDQLNGGDGDDILEGGNGLATLLSFYDGGSGDDLMIASSLGIGENFNGGSGNDTVSFITRTSSVNLTLSFQSLPLIDTVINTENVVGTNLADVISGDAGNNRLEGAGGDDILNGGAGDDILIGGAGTDTMTGGAGDDTYYVDDPGDTIIEQPDEGFDTVYASGSFSLASAPGVERVIVADATSAMALDLTGNDQANALSGNAGSNTLDGRGGDDVLDGRGGADTMIGGIGDDIYYVDDARDVVYENAREGEDTVFTSVSYALTANSAAERLATADAAGSNPISLTGNAFANLLTGNAGANVLNGGAGADVMRGLAGSDTYYVDNSADVVEEAAGGGSDTIFTSVNYQLSAGSEIELLAA